MTSAALAALLALLTCILALPPRPGGLHRLTARTSARRPRGITHLPRALPLALLAAVLTATFGAQLLVSTLAIAAVLALVASQRAQHRRRAATTARRTQIIEALDALAADLTATRPPIEDPEGAASTAARLHAATRAANPAGDVPAALDQAANAPGAAGLRPLAAAW